MTSRYYDITITTSRKNAILLMEGPGVAPNVRSNVTFLLGLMLGLKIVKHLCTGDFSVKLLGLWKNRKIYLPTPASLTPPLSEVTPKSWTG